MTVGQRHHWSGASEAWVIGDLVVLCYTAHGLPAWVFDRRLPAAEADVVRAAVAGSTNADIARRRGTSVRTVANQLASAFRRLGVSGRAELASLAAQCVHSPAERP